MVEVGQIVHIKEKLQTGKAYGGITFVSDMARFKGKDCVVKRAYISTFTTEESEYIFSEKMCTKESLKKKKFKKYKFKVGDKVIGNEKAKKYAYTKPGTIWEVKEVYDSGFRVAVDNYVVDYECFDLYEEEKEETEKEEVKEMEEEIIETKEEETKELIGKLTKSIDKLSKKVESEDPFREAMIKAIIEKGKDLAIEDLKDRLKDQLDDYIEETYGKLPQKIIIEENGLKKKELQGIFHKKFEEICKMVASDIPIMLVGGAGSGKSHTLEQTAEALGLDFYSTSSVNQEYKLTGFIDANGVYHETEFYKAYTNGGLYFMDEIDASSPEALVILNGAIANKYFDFPIGRIKAHKDFRVVCAGNTYGTGADMVYVGRNVLDGATLDRFVVIEFDYDQEVERKLAYDEELFEFIEDLRSAVNKSGLRYIVSMRALINATKMLEIGMDKETILRNAIVKNMQRDDLNTIVGKLDSGNSWYREIKRLCD